MNLTNDSATGLVLVALFLLIAAMVLTIAGAMKVASDEEERTEEFTDHAERDSTEHDN